jgi:hypothetical protein
MRVGDVDQRPGRSGGPHVAMHGADLYRFRDGIVAAKIAYRKNVRT